MICSIDGEVIDPATTPGDCSATRRRGGPGWNTTVNMSPTRKLAKTVRSGELSVVFSVMLHGSGGGSLPPSPAPPFGRGIGLDVGLQVSSFPPPPPPPDIISLPDS